VCQGGGTCADGQGAQQMCGAGRDATLPRGLGQPSYGSNRSHKRGEPQSTEPERQRGHNSVATGPYAAVAISGASRRTNSLAPTHEQHLAAIPDPCPIPASKSINNGACAVRLPDAIIVFT